MENRRSCNLTSVLFRQVRQTCRMGQLRMTSPMAMIANAECFPPCCVYTTRLTMLDYIFTRWMIAWYAERMDYSSSCPSYLLTICSAGPASPCGVKTPSLMDLKARSKRAPNSHAVATYVNVSTLSNGALIGVGSTIVAVITNRVAPTAIMM